VPPGTSYHTVVPERRGLERCGFEYCLTTLVVLLTQQGQSQLLSDQVHGEFACLDVPLALIEIIVFRREKAGYGTAWEVGKESGGAAGGALAHGAGELVVAGARLSSFVCRERGEGVAQGIQRRNVRRARRKPENTRDSSQAL